jgi:hypothetical protein
VYRLAMWVLCGRDLAERRRAIVRELEPGWTFLDLCCGDCAISPAVRAKSCTYLGLEVNPVFIRWGQRRGFDVRHWDARSMPVPRADVVCMQASLYQFIPRDRSLVHEIVASANRLAVVAEPTRNWATGGSRLLRALASRLTRAAGDVFDKRHSDASLADLVADFPPDAVRVLRLRREAVVFVDAARIREAAAV